jgi:hypothetical protein
MVESVGACCAESKRRAQTHAARKTLRGPTVKFLAPSFWNQRFWNQRFWHQDASTDQM